MGSPRPLHLTLWRWDLNRLIMDEREFYNFVEETKGLVFSAIRKYMASQYYHSIDDVAQETYIRAYKSLMKKNEFDDEKSRNNWLYTIAKNETLRMLQKLNKEELKLNRAKESITFDAKNHLQNFNEDIIEMKDVISTLPEKYRSIFELLIQGFTESQIADKLSMKSGTVKSRIHRGRELIIRTSKRRGINYG